MPDTFEQRQQRAQSLLTTAGILPVLTVDSVELALSAAKALADGGLLTIELVLRTPASLNALAAIKDAMPDLKVGAGTVLAPAQVDAVEELGADFIVTPGVSPHLLDALIASSLPIIPGAATPSELLTLAERGIRVAKLFPAANLGGPGYIKALAGPLPDMKLCANGGIDETSAPDYLALPNVLCVGGSWMVPSKWLAGGDMDAIRTAAGDAARIAADRKT